ncbi:MAG: alpha/beta fold hydrolase [Syntrophomonadaceae bacterium]
MKRIFTSFYFLYIFQVLLFNTAFSQEQKFAELGDFKLKSGEYIRSCRIGYRTFGTLNKDKSNVVLMPTWASGISEQLKSNVGPGRLVDSSKYFVIGVDALCNGVSSSPSNSTLQPKMSFPKITASDMVNSQYELLRTVFKLEHIKAVVGASMGGMQAFQWMISYPDFMDKVIPIVGSPRLSPYDLVLHDLVIRSIMTDPVWNNGNYTESPARVMEQEFYALILTTPEDVNKNMQRENIIAELEKAKGTKGFDANDKIRQTQAMMSLDISENFGGSMEKAAGSVKAKTLIITSLKDRIVNPAPAIEFGRMLNTKVIELNNDCGHLAPGCDAQLVSKSIADFLEQ